YSNFSGKPPVYLVHGESRSQAPLASALESTLQAPVAIAKHGQVIDVAKDQQRALAS
ncbi:MAG: hypothetical protein HKN77_02985, partial [Woeseiaceae bacterium]|nr:hypothetical protein [Woeseiaceae bacterium]